MSDRTELIPRSVGKREREERERREAQQSQMDVRRLEQKESIYHQAVAASQDRDYMTAALASVREKAHITHSDSVTRISGSYLYNKTLDNKSVK